MPAIICPRCGQLNAIFGPLCSGCGATLRIDAVPTSSNGCATGSLTSAADAPDSQWITTREFALLMHHARSLPTDDPVRHEIADKLARCEIVLSTEVPPELVTLNSRVVFRIEGLPDETRLLIDPRAHATPGLTLPVTTPLGISLLGAFAGDCVSALRRDAGREIVEIVEVAYQPEASRRLLARCASRGPADWPAPTKLRLLARSNGNGPDDPGPEAA